MKIEYISVHAVLEYDEIKLLTELGHEVHSNGAYRDPRGAYTLPRPGVDGMAFSQEFFDLTARYPQTQLPPELIDPYDVIIIMAGQDEAILLNNWSRIRHKRVIWRTIGQSLSRNEAAVAPLVGEGLQVVRYSPCERNLPGYAGEHALIRFHKDPEEFKDWTGHDARPVNFTQSLRGRADFTHYEELYQVLQGYPEARVYGTGNNDIGVLNGGELPYDLMKGILRDCRVFVYAGTFPASYTLSFIEAMMTGIPVVSISARMAELPQFDGFHFFEVPDIIQNGQSGFICDSIQDMRDKVGMLVGNLEMARAIGAAGRKRAIELFGKDRIKVQWDQFLRDSHVQG